MSSGSVVLTSYYIPSTVTAGQLFNWYAVGHVTGGTVTNPAIGLYYVSGPSPYILIVGTNGNTIQLRQGTAIAAFIPGAVGPCTTIDTRGGIAGAILPQAGSYQFNFIAGWLSADEASGVQMTSLGYLVKVLGDVRYLSAAGVGPGVLAL